MCSDCLGQYAHPLMPTLPSKAKRFLSPSEAPARSPTAIAGGGRRSADRWDCGLGSSSPAPVRAASPALGVQPSGNSLLNVLGKMQWASFFFFLSSSPVVTDVF